MSRKIPPEMVEEVLAKSASGLGARPIAEWLASEKGVAVDHATVARLVKREGAARASAAKTVARTRMAAAVLTDVDRTGRQLRTAVVMASKLRNDPELWVKVNREIRELIALRAKLAGLDQPDEQRQTAIVILPAEEEA